MKAAVLHAANQPLTIEDVALTKPGPREVLLRTALCRAVPQRSALYRGPLPTSDALRAGARIRRHCRGGRRRRHLCQAGRPRHHLPFGILRHLPAMPDRPPKFMREHRSQDAAGRRAPPVVEGRRTDEPVLQPFVLRRADAGPRECDGEDRPRHPARPRRLGRLRRDDRGRRGVQRRQGRAGRDSGGDRLWRGRIVSGEWRGIGRRRAHHCDRHGPPRSSKSRASSALPTR